MCLWPILVALLSDVLCQLAVHIEPSSTTTLCRSHVYRWYLVIYHITSVKFCIKLQRNLHALSALYHVYCTSSGFEVWPQWEISVVYRNQSDTCLTQLYLWIIIIIVIVTGAVSWSQYNYYQYYCPALPTGHPDELCRKRNSITPHHQNSQSESTQAEKWRLQIAHWKNRLVHTCM